MTSVTSPASVASRGYARVLEQPTRLGKAKLHWKEVADVDRDVFLLPRYLELELPLHVRVDLRDYAIRESRLTGPTVVEDSFELGFMIGTFLGVNDQDCLPSFRARLNRMHRKRLIDAHGVVKVLERRELNTADSEAAGRAVDALLNYETVKSFGAERRAVEGYDAALEVYAGAAVRAWAL